MMDYLAQPYTGLGWWGLFLPQLGMPDFPSEALPPQRSGWGTRSGKVGGRGKRGRMRNWGRYAKKKNVEFSCLASIWLAMPSR